ncbi:HYR domain-containing protein, partial [bacterium]|nr:HYR domain-containing protein [bacterium]
TATATDNCSVATITHLPLAPYSIGSTTVTWTATDVNGNTSSCSQTVIVTDNEAPIVTCGGNVTVNNGLDSCSAFVTVASPATSDNCGVATIVNDYNGGANASDVYSVTTGTTVTWTITDIHGNQSTCSQVITVIDNEGPSITCPATATISANAGLCTSNLSIGTATASDNCGVASVTHSPVGPYTVGFTSVTWTATDIHGNTSTCNQTVHVTDNELPVITCPGTANISADAGSCTSSASIGAASATDNCSGVIVSHLPVGPYPVGTTTVTWTATDASGNTSACNQTVVVTDNEAPVVNCSAVNVTANNDLGFCAAIVTVPSPVITDNCGSIAFVTNDFNGGTDASDAYPVGTTTITWYVTDIHGNSSSCQQLVTITDNELPTITCAANVIQNAGSGLCTAVVTVLSPTANDNCQVASVINDFNNTANASGTYPVGVNLVTWTVTDIHGNTNACVQTVTIIDNQNPTV